MKMKEFGPRGGVPERLGSTNPLLCLEGIRPILGSESFTRWLGCERARGGPSRRVLVSPVPLSTKRSNEFD